MKIEIARSLASGQFIQIMADKEKATKVLGQYAIEELQMNADKAKEFAKEGIEGKPLDGLTTDTDKFFLWYYINYIAINPPLS